jgi:hypothetical protein
MRADHPAQAAPTGNIGTTGPLALARPAPVVQ